jgi:hypothetical protein
VQPICAADVASCLLAVLDRAARADERHEVAGPQELSWRGFAALAAAGRVLAVPPAALRPALLAYEALTGPAALLTWDEAARAQAGMTTERGTADANALGVEPRAPAEVFGSKRAKPG